MTELERLAAAIVAQWQAQGSQRGGPISVAALIDTIFPYRVARREIGIDASEDYEALLLRLLAEEENIARVEPVDAADMARATIASKLPDLAVLQLLRGASVTITDRAIARLQAAAKTTAASPPANATAIAAPDAMAEVAAPSPTTTSEPANCWRCEQSLPAGRPAKFCPACGADQREPKCAACGATLEREWKHCVECGEAKG